MLNDAQQYEQKRKLNNMSRRENALSSVILVIVNYIFLKKEKEQRRLP